MGEAWVFLQEKAMSRTKRKPYTGAKRRDTRCRCHGSCSWCRSDRLHRHRKRLAAADEQIKVLRHIVEVDSPRPDGILRVEPKI